VTRHFLLPQFRAAGMFRSIFRADRYYYTVQFEQKPAGRTRAAARPGTRVAAAASRERSGVRAR